MLKGVTHNQSDRVPWATSIFIRWISQNEKEPIMCGALPRKLIRDIYTGVTVDPP